MRFCSDVLVRVNGSNYCNLALLYIPLMNSNKIPENSFIFDETVKGFNEVVTIADIGGQGLTKQFCLSTPPLVIFC